ncbi:MAG: hypothetical protein SFY67_07750 [Candidatus Melainabacteria bacterium]|nr:hypothetical protein [Candidatus Melainabacteria bacterium]
MSPRAFQTVLVAPMAPKERKDLESRVLAAAFKQSFQRGDTEGANLAHKQIYLLLKAGEVESAVEANGEGAADNGASQEHEVEPVQPNDRAGTREINLNNAEYAKLEVEAMEKLTPKAKAKLTKENASIAAGATATASKLPAQTATTDSASQVSDRATTQDQEIPKANSYVLLNVEPGASFREIHISFLRLVRKLLFEFNQAPKKKRRGMIKDLLQISIAHDILSDPLTRTDYDIRFLGLKAPVAGTTEGVTESGGVLFKVGELLESAGLLEPTELEIAADMHKAMPEMLFGTFLVKQGFITDGDLDQAVLGQELVKDALIKLDVFKQAMAGWLSSQTPIKEYLVKENIISKEDMDRIVSKNLQEIQVQKVAQSQQPMRGPSSKIQAVSAGPMINTEEAAKRMISKGHAIPGWKDQLDWSQPEEEEIAKFEQAVRQDKEYARPDIEDIGSGAAQKSGKKSLRSLMDGIHAPETNEAPKAKTRKTIADLMGPLGDEDFNKPASVDEISNLSQLLQPEELQEIEALESIDQVAIANDVVRIKDAMSDTSESIKRPVPPQAEKYSDITADKLVPEMAAPPASLRTWMEEESPLGFGFDEGSYDEEEDIEFSFDFGRSSEEDESIPSGRFVDDSPVNEDIDNPFDHLDNNEDSLEDDLDAAYGRTPAPDLVPAPESEFPQEQDELWEYVEDANNGEQAGSNQIEETPVEFVEDEETEVEEMVEVEVVVEADADEDKDPTGTKTREFEIELAAEEELEQVTGTKSGWSIEPFKAPKAPPIEDLEKHSPSYVEPKEDLETTKERASNLEETAAISTDLAKRAVAEAQSKALKEAAESQDDSELGFSVHIVQADEDSTIEDLDPIVITSENEQPQIEQSQIEQAQTNHQGTDPQAATTPPGNEETSEWQLVYKISGSLADALMNDDDDEADMSNLAPKLDDVNVFVTPSQFSGRPITKEWDRVEEKGDTQEDEE